MLWEQRHEMSDGKCTEFSQTKGTFLSIQSPADSKSQLCVGIWSRGASGIPRTGSLGTRLLWKVRRHASRLVEWVKAPAVKPADPSSIPGAPTWWKARTDSPTPSSGLHTLTVPHTFTPRPRNPGARRVSKHINVTFFFFFLKRKTKQNPYLPISGCERSCEQGVENDDCLVQVPDEHAL